MTYKPKILLVDDDLAFSAQVLKFLEERYEALRATTVREALDILDASPGIDLLVIEIVMPAPQPGAVEWCGGLQIIDRLRKQRPTHLPIIVLSTFAAEFADELRELGVSAVMDKRVVSSRDVIDVIERILEEQTAIKEKEVQRSVDREYLMRSVATEVSRLLSRKEQSLLIPGAGVFELMKPLQGYRSDIESQLLRYPFDKNVFLMMKFRDSNCEVAEYIMDTLGKNGLRGIRADDEEWNITSNVYNPLAVIYCCKYGIALFDEPEDRQAYSANVAYELAMMHYQNKECLILRHASLPEVPFDLVKDVYVTYNRDLQLKSVIERWVRQVMTRSKGFGET